jgi:hypothetical protein
MRKLGWFGFFLSLLPFVVTGISARAQGAASPAAMQEIALLEQALWGGVPVHQVELSGTATRYAGSDVEQGAVTLTATAAGSSSMELSFGDMSRKVTTTALDPGRQCAWSRNGTSHQMGYMNCLKPLVWFLPGITLQSSLMPSSIGIDDLGTAQVDGMSFRRLQIQAVMSGLDKELLKECMKRSSMNLDLNPRTLLPARLSYILHPDDGSQTKIHIEIRFSDYRKAGNTEIPYHIERYVNGSLQLDIQINSVNLS